MATIVDVAKAAGVSTATVSHVLNSTRPVSDKTRRRVLEAVATTGYRMHTVARALRRSRTDTVGLVLNDSGSPVFEHLILGVEQEAKAAGKTVLLAHGADDRDRERAAVLALRDKRVDGILFAPSVDFDPRVVDPLTEAGIPLVVVDRPSALPVDYVGVENVAPMRALAEHLLDIGHTRVAFVSQGAHVATLTQRLHGWRAAMLSRGLEVDARLVVDDTSPAVVRQRLREVLGASPAVTALTCASQQSTTHALTVVEELGLRVPEDLALVTFDDFPFADLFHPRITSVAQPAFEIGRTAVRLLLERTEQPDGPVQSILLPAEYRHRDSCGCGRSVALPPAADPVASDAGWATSPTTAT